MEAFWSFLSHVREELLLFSAVFFIIGGLDELAVDLIWGARKAWRWITRYRLVPPLNAHELPAPAKQGPLAIFIPAWREATVIGKMLRQCRHAWAGGKIDYRIYVGCYANDPGCIAAVMSAASGDRHIRLVLCDQPGPTTKADCLNRLWRALTRDELTGGYKVKALILHDAEDSVDPMELRLFDYLVEKAAAVQLPVVPIQVPGSAWVSGHYCDEFAEAHGKTLVVREALGASMPLAGVGCAIERNQLGRVAIERAGEPFDAQSLTEDYELGLGIGADGGKVIFARIKNANGDLVATRACFPDTFRASARQKARWMTGIALAGWDRLGWQGGWAEIWMRLRDRKGVLNAIVLGAAYCAIILTVILIGAEGSGLFTPPPLSPAVKMVLALTLALLVWRAAIRWIFVRQMHGIAQAFLSVPRSAVANVIAIAAARRACWTYIHLIFGGKLHWDKTTHTHFPEKASQNG